MDNRSSKPKPPFFSWLSPGRRRSLFFLIYTVIGLWNFSVIVASKLADNELKHPLENFVDEMTGAYCALALLPLALWFFRVFPLRRKSLAPRLSLYFLAGSLYAGLQMILMAASRNFLYPALGLGRYDYGRLFYRYLQENLKIQVFMWVLFGALLYFSAAREREEQRIQASRLEEQLTRARLQNLQTQIHPHFLFNALNTISATMYESVEAADRMIADLSELLRTALVGGGPAEHGLERELEIARLFVGIMKARFGERLAVTYEVQEEARRALVPAFLLQPLVENAIKHGQVEGRTTEILVRAQIVPRGLRLTVEDNGPGLKGDPREALRSGIGLSNTAERLERLYGRGQEFFLRNRDGGGLAAVAEIPFRTPPGREARPE